LLLDTAWSVHVFQGSYNMHTPLEALPCHTTITGNKPGKHDSTIFSLRPACLSSAAPIISHESLPAANTAYA